MKHFVVHTKDGKEVNFNFPTSINELSEDYLKQLSDNIVIADNYSLVAIVYETKLSSIILTARANSKKDTKIKTTPLFVNCGTTTSAFINGLKPKQRIIIADSQLSLGHHINMPFNDLDITKFADAVRNSTDKDIYDNEVLNPNQDNCCFVSFKIVPNIDIKTAIGVDLKKPTISFVETTPINQ